MPDSTDRSAKKPFHLWIDRCRFEYVFGVVGIWLDGIRIGHDYSSFPSSLTYRPDQLDESRDDTDDQPGQVQPRCMQPSVEQHADDPSNEGSCREHERQLAVPRESDKEVAV